MGSRDPEDRSLESLQMALWRFGICSLLWGPLGGAVQFEISALGGDMVAKESMVLSATQTRGQPAPRSLPAPPATPPTPPGTQALTSATTFQSPAAREQNVPAARLSPYCLPFYLKLPCRDPRLNEASPCFSLSVLSLFFSTETFRQGLRRQPARKALKRRRGGRSQGH